MAGYVGTKAVLLSTTAANVGGDADIGGALDVGGAITGVDAILSGGVYLGGTVAANKLDDYEGGTFTPVVVGQTTAGTGTYTLQKGGYTKVGELVHFQIQLGWSAHTGTGNFVISGLPFTSGSVTPVAHGGAFIAYNNGFSYTSGSNLRIYVGSSSNILAFTEDDAGSLAAITMDTFCTEIIIVGSYIAA